MLGDRVVPSAFLTLPLSFRILDRVLVRTVSRIKNPTDIQRHEQGQDRRVRQDFSETRSLVLRWFIS